MSNNDLRQKTISSMVWNAMQRFGTMAISFVSNLVLVRLLVPDDFGCIGMLSIFIVLSGVFVDGGFGSALIQKKETTQEDYSTIFFWNLAVAIALYFILYIFSPIIAGFYHMPALKDILRVTSVVLIINGFSVIQSNILTKQLAFKLQAKIGLVSVSFSVVVSIVAAFCGLGVWSLVIKEILAALISAILLWKLNDWRPSLIFSLKSFRELFGFGGLMLLSRLLNAFFENLQGLVIGRYYTAKDLGFYSQAKRLNEIPSSSLSQIVTNVTFPVFSKISENRTTLKSAVKKNIVCTTYLIFPLQIFLIVVADSLIVFLFSEKWIESVPYFRIICIYSLFISLNAINTNIYVAIGKSNVYFYVQLIKKLIGAVLLIVGIQYGVLGITWSLAASGFIWWVIASTVNVKLLEYGFMAQSKDIFKSFLSAAIIGIATYWILSLFSFPPFINLCFCTVIYLMGYILISIALRNEPYYIYFGIIKSYIYKHK